LIPGLLQCATLMETVVQNIYHREYMYVN
jgi:hypothetical protein